LAYARDLRNLYEVTREAATATRLGVAAIRALADGHAGCMMAVRGGGLERAPLTEVVGRTRGVDPESERVRVARSVGTIFGDG
jgi:ATP-dependent phosphofructokinase / diphosphate-dependent phosphofructokinase